ncbi:hypothetical protein GGI07_000388 [Coemansia sp. Benny D115]|nr:hypothetical protein GGI07_000388 [Coemansia sp. Benny D115]
MISVVIKCSNDKKVTLEVDEQELTVLQLKEQISKELEDTPAESQRLIYAGRILKDGDKLSSYKIADGNTIHMVKGGAKKAAAPGAASRGAAIRDDNANPAPPAQPSGTAASGAPSQSQQQSGGASAASPGGFGQAGLPDLASMLGGMGSMGARSGSPA